MTDIEDLLDDQMSTEERELDRRWGASLRAQATMPERKSMASMRRAIEVRIAE